MAPSEYPEELLATTETTKRRRRRKRRGKRGGASAAGAAGTGRPKSTAELAEEARREVERFKDLARREFLIGHVADVLAAQVQATRELAEKRLVRTHDEIAVSRHAAGLCGGGDGAPTPAVRHRRRSVRRRRRPSA